MSTVEHPTGPSGKDDSVGALVTQASQQLSQLVRDEMRLAQAEMAQKGKRFGIGGGLFGGAGMVAFLALQALVATGIAALALVLPVWASALIVFGVLLVIAGVLALVGKKQVAQAGPPAPERAIDGVKADVAEIKEKAHR
ncbi:phage holin family protein [Streptomyces sp. ISL-99]|uniref:phage holin family protein n=1 Tax=Streptomyces sp. ISL-99 TaxID=2819193 RepID=UPI001BE72480|nr:phage holin family protein [Streptomyces sp. ISL-99]MBT2529794.1 phage holin family protein [Streptomyces sp. ISL-99]